MGAVKKSGEAVQGESYVGEYLLRGACGDDARSRTPSHIEQKEQHRRSSIAWMYALAREHRRGEPFRHSAVGNLLMSQIALQLRVRQYLDAYCRVLARDPAPLLAKQRRTSILHTLKYCLHG